jgi:hypothetical protein
MSVEDQAVKNYYSLSPTQFNVLVKFALEQQTPPGVSPPELSLKIELRPDNDADNRRLSLSFFGVRKLELIQPSWSLFKISHLAIISTREEQLEDLNYNVTSDDDSISFLCKKFDVSLENL